MALDEIADAETFRSRDAGDVASLAESLIRHGQREPVDLRPIDGGLQLVSGHRRLEAARMLGRRRILARVHDGLEDDAALFLALSDDLDRRPWTLKDLEGVREMLSTRESVPSSVSALLDRAAAELAVSEAADEDGGHEEEVDADVMAASVRDRLADACNDLSALHELWGDLDEGRRADLVQCVAYLKDMYPFLVASEQEDP